jgi:hypothetical protein
MLLTSAGISQLAQPKSLNYTSNWLNVYLGENGHAQLLCKGNSKSRLHHSV